VSQQNRQTGKARFVLQATVLSAVTGASVLAVAGQIAGGDPALKLASQLSLDNGIVLAGIVGGLVGIWLALGTLGRAAGWASWTIAIPLGIVLFLIGRHYVWILDVGLVGAFGQSASGLAPFIGFGLILAVVRTAAATANPRVMSLFRYVLRREAQEVKQP